MPNYSQVGNRAWPGVLQILLPGIKQRGRRPVWRLRGRMPEWRAHSMSSRPPKKKMHLWQAEYVALRSTNYTHPYSPLHNTVDGQWSAWTITKCGGICPNLSYNISRTCTNPRPRFGGKYCEGEEGSRTELCSVSGASAVKEPSISLIKWVNLSQSSGFYGFDFRVDL